MKKHLLFISLLPVLLFGAGCSRNQIFGAGGNRNQLPAWKEGYLDIHSINTGRGECTFYILPDGTTMLIDAGEFSTNTNVHPLVPQKPDSLTRPSATYARYIKHFLPRQSRGAIDYVLLTHFHMDHMGRIEPEYATHPEGNYVKTGISALCEDIPYRKVVDRIWPDYDSVRNEVGGKEGLANWKKFMDYGVSEGDFNAERFETGSFSQFVLSHHPERYPSFRIQNLAANGWYWDGKKAVDAFDGKIRRENASSCVLLLSYGDFDWYAGGDCADRKIEVPIARSVGRKIEAMKSNHHLSWNTMDTLTLAVLQPRVIVSQSFYSHQPDVPVLETNIYSDKAYTGDKSLYFTNIPPYTLEVMPSLAEKAASLSGHVVIRVAPGGGSFRVYVLKDTDFSYEIQSVSDTYTCQ